ncbi:486_t:CDS:2 [Ambispora gerdemannii]|uniref:486_t:CDS:1 n=1 Tax=Ambispora gerdemannii TaxID=144530 RepID=A0A9N9F5E3_9GLOM|nr:486_t:CDS:2 [Ambispora gerdemannii]
MDIRTSVLFQPFSPTKSEMEITTETSTTEIYTATSKVGFDTFSPQETVSREFSFTLQKKVAGYKRTKWSRTFLVATDLEKYSDNAVEWLLENLVDNSDEIVALRVVPFDFMDSSMYDGDSRVSKSSMLSSVETQKEKAMEDANQLMQKLIELNDEKALKINIVVEFMIGKVQDTIQHMIKMYQPESLVVGTRGRSQAKSLLMGSISMYCLQNSPVPVIVVRPEKRVKQEQEKKLKKRQKDLPEPSSASLSQAIYSTDSSQSEERSTSIKSLEGLEDTSGEIEKTKSF